MVTLTIRSGGQEGTRPSKINGTSRPNWNKLSRFIFYIKKWHIFWGWVVEDLKSYF